VFFSQGRVACLRRDVIKNTLGMNRVSIFSPGEYSGAEQIKAAGTWADQVLQVTQWLSRPPNGER